jgi:hypothetical protein
MPPQSDQGNPFGREASAPAGAPDRGRGGSVPPPNRAQRRLQESQRARAEERLARSISQGVSAAQSKRAGTETRTVPTSADKAASAFTPRQPIPAGQVAAELGKSKRWLSRNSGNGVPLGRFVAERVGYSYVYYLREETPVAPARIA